MKGSEFKDKIVEFRKYEKLGIFVRDNRLPPHAEPVLMLGINPEDSILEVDNRVAINALLIIQLMTYFENEHFVFEFMHQDNADEIHAAHHEKIKAYEDSLKAPVH